MEKILVHRNYTRNHAKNAHEFSKRKHHFINTTFTMIDGINAMNTFCWRLQIVRNLKLKSLAERKHCWFNSNIEILIVLQLLVEMANYRTSIDKTAHTNQKLLHANVTVRLSLSFDAIGWRFSFALNQVSHATIVYR